MKFFVMKVWKNCECEKIYFYMKFENFKNIELPQKNFLMKPESLKNRV